MRRSLLPLLLVLLPTLLLAKKLGQGGGSDPLEGYFVRISAPQPGETLTRSVAGDFDGDAQQDVAYLMGERVEVMIDPGLYEALMSDVSAGKDMVPVPGDERDDLLVVDWLGLKQVSWDVHDVDPNSYWTTQRFQASEWIGVDLLRTWSRAGESPHVFGRGANGTSIVWMEPKSGGWVTQPIFDTNSPEAFLDLAPLDFDADGEPELAVIFDSGIAVYELGDPVPVAQHSFTGFSSVALARVRHPDGVPETTDSEYAAWIGEAANGIQYFALVGEVGLFNAQNIGSAETVTIRTGDVDTDGDDDLICASTASWNLTWVENTGVGGPAFSPATAVSRGPTVNLGASQNAGWPVIVDLDGDGDGDVAYPVHDDEPFLWIRKEEAVAQAALRPRLITELLNGLSVGATVDAVQTLRFEVEVDPSMPGEHLKVVAWTQDDPNATMNPAPIFQARLQLDDRGQTISRTIELTVPGGPSQYAPPEQTASFEPLVYVLLQLYDGPSPNAPPSAVYPGLLVILHGQGILDQTGVRTPNEQFVASLQCPFEFAVVIEDQGVASLDGPGGEEGGKGGDVPCTPVPPNNPPTGR